ncbi:MAG: T9SS type A sorting domain-containing protein [Chitinophagales bacterium]|nr:T9SS type A sorting domain-containing protein [Chitinophagales bacterium]
MKQLLSLILVLLNAFAISQVVSIPDSSFKYYLINNTAINTNNDTSIQISEALSVDTLILNDMGIYSLVGIEEFKNLEYLDCRSNEIDSLDIDSNQNLKYLSCYRNNLYELNTNNNEFLTTLHCTFNNLNGLELDNNLMLRNLSCEGNNLDTLFIGNNINLIYLSIGGDLIENLDISNNINLYRLSLFNSQIKQLDFSNNTNLYNFECHNTAIEYIDLSNHQNLSSIFIVNSLIESLNLDNCTNLSSVRVRGNSLLKNFSVKIGNNNQNVNYFSSNGNISLFCIGIDYPLNTNWNKDIWTDFNDNCPQNSCESLGLYTLPYLCLYGQEWPSTNPTIDTLVNSEGCDSLLIINYNSFSSDVYSVYDSIMLRYNSDFLQPYLYYRTAYELDPLEGPFETIFPNIFYEFQWYLNDTAIYGATDSIYYPNVDGEYKAQISLKNVDGLCKIFSFPYMIKTTGIYEQNNNVSFDIKPNPFLNFIDINTDLTDEYKLIIYDVLGRVLFKNNYMGNQKIDLSKIEKGVYYIGIIKNENEGIVYSKKLIKK